MCTSVGCGPRSSGTTELPPGTTLRLLSGQNGQATLALDSHQLPAADRTTAIAQIVLSATSVPGIGAVRLTLDGRALETPLADGALTTRPLTAADYRTMVRAEPPNHRESPRASGSAVGRSRREQVGVGRGAGAGARGSWASWFVAIPRHAAPRRAAGRIVTNVGPAASRPPARLVDGGHRRSRAGSRVNRFWEARLTRRTVVGDGRAPGTRAADVIEPPWSSSDCHRTLSPSR